MNQRSGSGIYALQEPLTLPGGLTLHNRVVQAPCTRNRATADLSPSAGASDYYAARADAGLLITEATLITPDAQGYLDTPGLFLDAHVAAWSVVTQAVHDRGGRIFAQLWHTCSRRLNIDPPCRFNIDPGRVVAV